MFSVLDKLHCLDQGIGVTTPNKKERKPQLSPEFMFLSSLTSARS